MKIIIALLSSIAFLSACGGGGGGDSPAASPATQLPFRAAIKARADAGAIESFSISGSCTGAATITTSAAAPVTFEGFSALAAVATLTANIVGCTPASLAVIATSYLDATTYTPIGSFVQGGDFAAVAGAPIPAPVNVSVGDTALLATFNVYSDSAKTTLTGRRELSYVIEQDGAATAIANLITRVYNSSNQLLQTQQVRYRIGGSGAPYLLSIDSQNSTTSTIHLIYTRI